MKTEEFNLGLEVKINDIIEYQGEKYKCCERTSNDSFPCLRCSLFNQTICINPFEPFHYCTKDCRSDKTDVWFIKVNNELIEENSSIVMENVKNFFRFENN